MNEEQEYRPHPGTDYYPPGYPAPVNNASTADFIPPPRWDPVQARQLTEEEWAAREAPEAPEYPMGTREPWLVEIPEEPAALTSPMPPVFTPSPEQESPPAVPRRRGRPPKQR